MDIKLTELQDLYNQSSIIFDKLEDEVYSLSEKIYNRIVSILKDPHSYKGKGDAGPSIVGLMNAMVKYVLGDDKFDTDNCYIVSDIIHYLVIDGEQHFKSKANFPDFANRLTWLQHDAGVTALQVEAEKEMRTLLTILTSLNTIISENHLYAAHRENDKLLPPRSGHGCISRTKNGKGLTESEWSKYEAA